MTRLRAALIAVCLSAIFAPNASAIVGGHDVPAGQRGYVAYITIDAAFACTGTLVTPTFVVTAGHCSSITGAAIATPIGQPGQLITVSLGSNKPDQGEHPPVKSVIVQDDYLFLNGSGNDVALIQLATPSRQTPVKIAGKGEEPLWAAGTMADIAGFGITAEDGNAPDTMQEAKVPITTDAYAQNAYPADWDGATMIGAGFPQGGVDTCQGDSGGPLLVPAPNNSIRLVGDTSFGDGCARPGKPGIYGRLGDTKLREWIRGKAPDAVAPNATPAAAPAPGTSQKAKKKKRRASKRKAAQRRAAARAKARRASR
jgi:secreted trypsin-like serine protease